MLTALFGIDDGSLNLAINLLILVLVIVWLSLVYWTWADARRRIGDPVLVTTATAASLVPFIGTVVYAILRPPEFLADVREREIETQASELRMRHLAMQSCPRCEHPIERTWLRCPECQHRLKDPCRSCNRPVDPRWSLCPYCETPIRKPAQAEGGRGRASAGRGADPERGKRDGGDAPPAKRRKPSSTAPPERSARSERKPRQGDDGTDGSDSSSGSGSGTRPRRRSATGS